MLNLRCLYPTTGCRALTHFLRYSAVACICDRGRFKLHRCSHADWLHRFHEQWLQCTSVPVLLFRLFMCSVILLLEPDLLRPRRECQLESFIDNSTITGRFERSSAPLHFFRHALADSILYCRWYSIPAFPITVIFRSRSDHCETCLATGFKMRPFPLVHLITALKICHLSRLSRSCSPLGGQCLQSMVIP